MDVKKLKEYYRGMYNLDLDMDLVYALIKAEEDRKSDRYKYVTTENFVKSQLRNDQDRKEIYGRGINGFKENVKDDPGITVSDPDVEEPRKSSGNKKTGKSPR